MQLDVHTQVARAIREIFERERVDAWEPQSILAVFDTIASPLKALLGRPGPLFESVGEKGVELFIHLRALVAALDATRTMGPDRQRVAQNIVFHLLEGTTSLTDLEAVVTQEYLTLQGVDDFGIDELTAAANVFSEALQTLVSAEVVYREGEEYFLA
jgi:hypothetical protein